ncbi:MAG: FMN-binding protein [Bdellovibrionales bacterium]
MKDEYPYQTPKIVGGVVITAVIMIGIYFLILNNKPVSGNASTTTLGTTSQISPTSTPITSMATTPAQSTARTSTTNTGTKTLYKDGTYTSEASYRVPHGTNTIAIKVTVSNDKISAVSAENSYSDRESRGYISGFMDALSGAVVGEKADSANVSRLAGASLTSDGFNQALESVVSQAKA